MYKMNIQQQHGMCLIQPISGPNVHQQFQRIHPFIRIPSQMNQQDFKISKTRKIWDSQKHLLRKSKREFPACFFSWIVKMEFWMALDRTIFENRGLGIRHASQRKTVTRASYISKERNHIFESKWVGMRMYYDLSRLIVCQESAQKSQSL